MWACSVLYNVFCTELIGVFEGSFFNLFFIHTCLSQIVKIEIFQHPSPLFKTYSIMIIYVMELKDGCIYLIVIIWLIQCNPSVKIPDWFERCYSHPSHAVELLHPDQMGCVLALLAGQLQWRFWLQKKWKHILMNLNSFETSLQLLQL